jgi:tripartite-type tricarboxylate transporter receptor subunit TctC
MLTKWCGLGALKLCALWAGLALGLVSASGAWAQGAFPNKPIRLIVATVPGGTTDLIARIAADGLSQQTGVSVVVENRGGATGSLALDFVMKSPADGYNLLVAANGNLLIKPFMDKSSGFDPATDLSPVFITSDSPHLIVVGKNVPVADMRSFVAYGKANPGKIFYGSAGLGTQPHISVSQLAKLTGMQVTHIPYKGLGSAMNDFLGGRLQVMSTSLGTVLPYIKGGEVKVLAVSGKRRLAALPDVPTAAEAGVPGWSMSAWFGIFAHKNTPPELVKLLNDKLNLAFEDPKIRQKVFEVGGELVTDGPAALVERIRAEHKTYIQLFKEGVITLE